MRGEEFRKLLADAAKEIKRLENEVEHYKTLYYSEASDDQ
jgi:archaellum component FlaC